MTLYQLKVFEAIATSLSVTKAAGMLHVSQPSISKHIKMLEEEFGRRLHEKNGRGIRLTPEGLRFLRSIKPILLQINTLHKDFRSEQEKKETAILGIGATSSPLSVFLPRALKSFKKAHPNVIPAVRTGNSHEVEKMLVNGVIEIGLITNPSHNPQIVLKAYSTEKLVAVISKKSSLVRKNKIDEKDMSNIPFILKTGGKTLRLIKGKSIKPNVTMECDSLETVLAAVRGGIGIGILYSGIAEPGLRSRELRRITLSKLDEIKISWYLAFKRSTSLSPAAADFLRFLLKFKPINQFRKDLTPPV